VPKGRVERRRTKDQKTSTDLGRCVEKTRSMGKIRISWSREKRDRKIQETEEGAKKRWGTPASHIMQAEKGRANFISTKRLALSWGKKGGGDATGVV